MDYKEEGKRSEDKRKTKVLSSQVLEYYQKYSQNKQLPKYFCGSSSSVKSSEGSQVNIPSGSGQPESIVFSRDVNIEQTRTLGLDSEKRKSPPIIIVEEVNDSIRAVSPTSSITSNKKLEWDSGADIGYENCQKQRYLQKSVSLPILTKLKNSDFPKDILRLTPEGDISSSSKRNTDDTDDNRDYRECAKCNEIIYQPTSSAILSECPKCKELLSKPSLESILENCVQCKDVSYRPSAVSLVSTSSSDSNDVGVPKSYENLKYVSSSSNHRLVDSDSDSSGKDKGLQGGSKELLKLIKKQVGFPLAESTPVGEGRSVVITYSDTPHIKHKKHPSQFKSQGSSEDHETKSSKKDASTSMVSSKLQSSSCEDIKSLCSIGRSKQWKSQNDLNEEEQTAKPQRTNHPKMLITKPIVVECVNYYKSKDKLIQTSLTRNVSTAVQTDSLVTQNKGKSQHEQVVPEKSKTPIRTRSSQQVVYVTHSASEQDLVASSCNSFEYLSGEEAAQQKYEQNAQGERSSTVNSSSSKQTADEAEIQPSISNKKLNLDLRSRSSGEESKHSLTGDDLENVTSESDKNSTDREISETIPTLGALISNKRTSEFAVDIEKSIHLLQKLAKSKRYDQVTKKYYLKKIVQKIVNSTYSDDGTSNEKVISDGSRSKNEEMYSGRSSDIPKSTSSEMDHPIEQNIIQQQQFLHNNLPWSPAVVRSRTDQPASKSSQVGNLHTTTFSSEFVPTEEPDGTDVVRPIGKSRSEVPNKKDKNSEKRQKRYHYTAADDEEKLQGSQSEPLTPLSLNENFENSNQQTKSSSGNETTSKNASTDRSSVDKSKNSWREEKTLSEKLFEERQFLKSVENCGGDNVHIVGDQILNFAKKERETQLNWINSEISHLSKLKKLLEKDKQKKEQPFKILEQVLKEPQVKDFKDVKKSTAVYVITTERSNGNSSTTPDTERRDQRKYHVQDVRMTAGHEKGKPCFCKHIPKSDSTIGGIIDPSGPKLVSTQSYVTTQPNACVRRYVFEIPVNNNLGCSCEEAVPEFFNGRPSIEASPATSKYREQRPYSAGGRPPNVRNHSDISRNREILCCCRTSSNRSSDDLYAEDTNFTDTSTELSSYYPAKTKKCYCRKKSCNKCCCRDQPSEGISYHERQVQYIGNRSTKSSREMKQRNYSESVADPPRSHKQTKSVGAVTDGYRNIGCASIERPVLVDACIGIAMCSSVQTETVLKNAAIATEEEKSSNWCGVSNCTMINENKSSTGRRINRTIGLKADISLQTADIVCKNDKCSKQSQYCREPVKKIKSTTKSHMRPPSARGGQTRRCCTCNTGSQYHEQFSDESTNYERRRKQIYSDNDADIDEFDDETSTEDERPSYKSINLRKLPHKSVCCGCSDFDTKSPRRCETQNLFSSQFSPDFQSQFHSRGALVNQSCIDSQGRLYITGCPCPPNKNDAELMQTVMNGIGGVLPPMEKLNIKIDERTWQTKKSKQGYYERRNCADCKCISCQNFKKPQKLEKQFNDMNVGTLQNNVVDGNQNMTNTTALGGYQMTVFNDQYPTVVRCYCTTENPIQTRTDNINIRSEVNNDIHGNNVNYAAINPNTPQPLPNVPQYSNVLPGPVWGYQQQTVQAPRRNECCQCKPNGPNNGQQQHIIYCTDSRCFNRNPYQENNIQLPPQNIQNAPFCDDITCLYQYPQQGDWRSCNDVTDLNLNREPMDIEQKQDGIYNGVAQYINEIPETKNATNQLPNSGAPPVQPPTTDNIEDTQLDLMVDLNTPILNNNPDQVVSTDEKIINKRTSNISQTTSSQKSENTVENGSANQQFPGHKTKKSSKTTNPSDHHTTSSYESSSTHYSTSDTSVGSEKYSKAQTSQNEPNETRHKSNKRNISKSEDSLENEDIYDNQDLNIYVQNHTTDSQLLENEDSYEILNVSYEKEEDLPNINELKQAEENILNKQKIKDHQKPKDNASNIKNQSLIKTTKAKSKSSEVNKKDKNEAARKTLSVEGGSKLVEENNTPAKKQLPSSGKASETHSSLKKSSRKSCGSCEKRPKDEPDNAKAENKRDINERSSETFKKTNVPGSWNSLIHETIYEEVEGPDMPSKLHEEENPQNQMGSAENDNVHIQDNYYEKNLADIEGETTEEETDHTVNLEDEENYFEKCEETCPVFDVLDNNNEVDKIEESEEDTDGDQPIQSESGTSKSEKDRSEKLPPKETYEDEILHEKISVDSRNSNQGSGKEYFGSTAGSKKSPKISTISQNKEKSKQAESILAEQEAAKKDSIPEGPSSKADSFEKNAALKNRSKLSVSSQHMKPSKKSSMASVGSQTKETPQETKLDDVKSSKIQSSEITGNKNAITEDEQLECHPLCSRDRANGNQESLDEKSRPTGGPSGSRGASRKSSKSFLSQSKATSEGNVSDHIRQRSREQNMEILEAKDLSLADIEELVFEGESKLRKSINSQEFLEEQSQLIEVVDYKTLVEDLKSDRETTKLNVDENKFNKKLYGASSVGGSIKYYRITPKTKDSSIPSTARKGFETDEVLKESRGSLTETLSYQSKGSLTETPRVENRGSLTEPFETHQKATLTDSISVENKGSLTEAFHGNRGKTGGNWPERSSKGEKEEENKFAARTSKKPSSTEMSGTTKTSKSSSKKPPRESNAVSVASGGDIVSNYHPGYEQTATSETEEVLITDRHIEIEGVIKPGAVDKNRKLKKTRRTTKTSQGSNTLRSAGINKGSMTDGIANERIETERPRRGSGISQGSNTLSSSITNSGTITEENGYKQKSTDETKEGPKKKPTIDKGTQIQVSSSSTTTTSTSTSSSSGRSCYCCNRKENVYRYERPPQDNGRTTQIRTEYLCQPCYTQNVGRTYCHPGHVCQCYKIIQTEHIRQMRDTIDQLGQMYEPQYQCCCRNSDRNNCTCKTRSKHKKNGIAYLLKLEETSLSEGARRHKHKKKHKHLEEVTVKIPVPRPKKKDKYAEESEDSDSGKENSPKKEKHKTKANHKVKRHKKHSLQDYLCYNRPDFLASAEERRKKLIELAYMREQRCEKYKQLLALTNGIPIHPSGDKPMRMFTHDEMKKITEKNYKKLPEVQKRLIDNKHKQIKKANRMLADIFNKKLREKVLKGTMTIPTDKSVINLV